ncbi:Endo-1, partial [Sesbania bispinosa]
MANNEKNTPFLFPEAHSTFLPDPSNFFSPNLLSTPLPTNSFFQNFLLKNGDQPEYIHPYLVKSSNSSLSVSYPSRSSKSSVISQVFQPNLTITSSSRKRSNEKHIISSYSDLSVTLDIPSSNMRFFLVRGSPFLTLSVTKPTPLPLPPRMPLFSSLQMLHLPGDAMLREPFCIGYKWEKKGWGDLLLLAHPLHLQLLSKSDCDVTILDDFKYRSIDGELVGVGDSWVLKTDPVSIT